MARDGSARPWKALRTVSRYGFGPAPDSRWVDPPFREGKTEVEQGVYGEHPKSRRSLEHVPPRAPNWARMRGTFRRRCSLYGEVDRHQDRTYEEAVAEPAGVSRGRLSRQTPPDEFALHYPVCSGLSGLHFLGVLQRVLVQRQYCSVLHEYLQQEATQSGLPTFPTIFPLSKRSGSMSKKL
jgi:hypothetical protein